MTLTIFLANVVKKLAERYSHRIYLSNPQVIGYISIPIGLASPIMVDGEVHLVPMATTEGCLLASTNRGAKATFESGGITTVIYGDKMTRSPVVKFDSIKRVVACIDWLKDENGFNLIKSHFDKTSRYGSLVAIHPFPVASHQGLIIEGDLRHSRYRVVESCTYGSPRPLGKQWA